MYSVLIADDEEIIRRGIKSLVEKEEGFSMTMMAEDGQEALSIASEKEPDVCIVDINMPFLNGLDFIERFHKLCPDSCVVIITGYDDFSYAQRALRAGVIEYLLKPINEEEFSVTMKKIKRRLGARDSNERVLKWVTDNNKEHTNVEDKRSSYSAITKAALDRLNEYFSDENLSLEETASALHVSAPYLSKTFKEETGDTFHNYLQRMRLRKAAEMLKDEDNMVKEIAYACGYSSLHYFSAAFKKETGMSPVEYRKSVINRD